MNPEGTSFLPCCSPERETATDSDIRYCVPRASPSRADFLRGGLRPREPQSSGRQPPRSRPAAEEAREGAVLHAVVRRPPLLPCVKPLASHQISFVWWSSFPFLSFLFFFCLQKPHHTKCGFIFKRFHLECYLLTSKSSGLRATRGRRKSGFKYLLSLVTLWGLPRLWVET